MGTKTHKSLRLLACSALLVLAALAVPSMASASSRQLSLLQDDAILQDGDAGDPAARVAEARRLGVDILRTNVIFNRVYRTPRDRRKPAGFKTSDPASAKYDWSRVDRLVNLARSNGIQVLLTITGPGPFFSSANPRRCGGRGVCTYKPKSSEFGAFAAAAVKRYRGRIAYYSLYNEAHLGKNWLSPRFARSGGITYDYAGKAYRKLWQVGYKSIARYDRARRNRVLFGETAAISSPIPFLRAALCLDPRGKPFTGRRKRITGCSGRVRKLNVFGFAHHPYNQSGNGTPRTKTKTKTSISLAYLPRLHRLMDGAARRGRIPGRRGIYITEFGFQSNPPDRLSNVSLREQAQYINEADRLFYSDRRVKSVAQYELFDPNTTDDFNTGLRFGPARGGGLKPSYGAYRVPIVVTRRSSSLVEVYGQARPAFGGTQVTVQVASGGGFTTVAQKSTNSRGIFRTNIRRRGASRARWRLLWRDPRTGNTYTSRTAKAGKRLRYYKG